MSRSPELGAALFNVETNWAEVSTTFGTRVQTIGAIDNSKLEQAKLTPQYTTQLVNEIKPGVNGVFGGEFEIKMMLTGHGSSTAGVLTLTALETLLGIFLGAVAAAGSNSTTAAAGGTVTALNVNAATGFTAGALIGPIGTIGDGRGNGQMVPIVSHAASVITTLIAIDAALSAADVIRNPSNSYTIEDPTANPAVTSTRWRFVSANVGYDCRGCYPKAITISGLGPGEEPMVTFRFGVSVFFETNNVVPSATSVQTFPHAAVSCGSMFLALQGTSTRSTVSSPPTKYDARTFSLTWDLGVVERKGHGGLYANQVIIGCSRVPSKGSVEFTIDAPDATASPDFVTKWVNNAVHHLCYVWGAEDSKAGALYLPYVVSDGSRPIQFDSGGIQSFRFRGRFGADATKSTALERAALRFAQG